MADIEIRQASPTAFYIKVHDTDNVAIIVNDNGLKAGTRFPDGLELIEHIPQGHKVALVDIPAHGEIVRYGEVIGYAVRAIPQGSWIEESLVELPTAPPLETLPLATRVPEPLPPLEGYTFEGYRNADGSVGTKNLLGITTSVHCVAGVVDYVVKIIERDLLPKYPNVDGVVGLNHLYGCGVAINAPAAVVPIRTIHNIALNPNFGGEVMVIGLGCEKLQPERLLQGTEDVKAIPVDDASVVRLQDEHHVGFRSMVDDILQVAERHLEKLNKRQRETCPASELVVGTQCGGSDAFSGVTANPAVGYASDLFVRCGATVMFSKSPKYVMLSTCSRRAPSTKRWANACWRKWPGTITISTWAKLTAAPTRLRVTRKAASRTWWKRPSGRLPNPARARLWKCSPRPATNQTRPDLRGNACQ